MEAVINLDDRAWVSDFLGKLQAIIESQGGQVQWIDAITGNKLAMTITQDLVTIIIANHTALQNIGLAAFKNTLSSLQKGQSFEALVTIYSKLDNSQLLQQYATDSAQLQAIAATTQKERDFWLSFVFQIGTKLTAGALGALLTGGVL